MKIIPFDERETTLKHALQSALVERDDYVFVRLNPHLASAMDNLLSIDFICFGKSAAPSLKNRRLVTTSEMLEKVVSRSVPSLVQLAKLNLPKHLPPLPSHVIKKLL